MGGLNSGRPRTRLLVEDCLPLDVAFLGKLNCFQGFARRHLSWVFNGEVSARATIEVTLVGEERPRAVLRMDGLATQTILLVSTRPNLGGERWWFVCPTTSRSCRTLYLTPSGDRFVSRQAANIAYRSSRLGPSDRIRWRAQQARDSLPGAEFQRYPPRPKGMHRKTYDKRVRRLRESDARALHLWHAFLGSWAERHCTTSGNGLSG
jgi:hypothetical protein